MAGPGGPMQWEKILETCAARFGGQRDGERGIMWPYLPPLAKNYTGGLDGVARRASGRTTVKLSAPRNLLWKLTTVSCVLAAALMIWSISWMFVYVVMLLSRICGLARLDSERTAGRPRA